RTKLAQTIGRVAFTDNIWTRVNLDSHLAITGHYIMEDANGNLVLRTQLLAFRRLEGSHTGENIGKVFVQVMKEIGCLRKVSDVVFYPRFILIVRLRYLPLHVIMRPTTTP
ncbi:hypothetical protein C8R44DRAFT_611868, partial [Mycena epipterygia]